MTCGTVWDSVKIRGSSCCSCRAERNEHAGKPYLDTLLLKKFQSVLDEFFLLYLHDFDGFCGSSEIMLLAG